MKTRTLLSLFVVCFITVNTFASNPETITFSNVEKTESGCVKEFLSCDKETNAPLSKTVYQYDAEDRLQEKATYEWNESRKEWLGIKKYLYSYDENNQPTTPVLLKWNKKTNDWSDK